MPIRTERGYVDKQNHLDWIDCCNCFYRCGHSTQQGRWPPRAKKWVKDNVHSPCIDAGDPKSEYKNEPKPNGGRVNMGAYGNTEEASKSEK